ncbi:cdc42 effector protein 3 [Electrophorus electricus]|uniref:CRIB domain-containing protein n=1 Tax=Electrophorus electricus TaxID=8005 RepID=A0A4W4H4H0_ELEEL|nr:cdc42 effector protein 3 [Electrophorus electricus]
MPLRTTLQNKPTSGRWLRNSSKRKVLSVNTISLPLADFRHLAHIGSDNHKDSFGDLSFLKHGHSLLLQSSQSEQNLLLACSPPPKPPRLNLDEAESTCTNKDSQCQPQAQRCKKCSSLPLLDMEDVEEESCELNPEEASISQSGDRRSLSSGKNSTQPGSDEYPPEESDTTFSFNLDLGPSILDDVLQVMDKLHQ